MAMLRRVRMPANRKPPKSAKKLARAVRDKWDSKESLLYRSKTSWNVKSLSLIQHTSDSKASQNDGKGKIER